ncbi:MAG: opacity family porin [Ignavibacteria bacterium]
MESPLIDSVREDWPYQMKVAYNLGAVGLFPITKQRNLNIMFGITYTAFSNNIDILVPAGTGSNIDAGADTGTTITFNPKINVFTLNLGLLYKFNLDKKLHPILSFDVTGNFLSGTVNFSNSPSKLYTSTDIKSAFRGGLQFGAGLEYMINDYFGLYGGMKYNFVNLIGKQADNSTQTISIALGDKEHTENGVTRSSKNISYIQISVGASLYFQPPGEQK